MREEERRERELCQRIARRAREQGQDRAQGEEARRLKGKLACLIAPQQEIDKTMEEGRSQGHQLDLESKM